MFLLKRNWFIDIQDIYSMFWELPEDVYYEVYQRRHEVPELAHVFHEDIPNKGRLKIYDIPDTEWEQMNFRIEEQRVRNARNFKNKYVAPPRPREYIDDAIDKLTSQVENKKIIMEDMLRSTKRSKKYVPPGQRVEDTEEPMVRETRRSLQTLENEFVKMKERLDTLNKLWTESKCLDAMLENAGRFCAI